MGTTELDPGTSSVFSARHSSTKCNNIDPNPMATDARPPPRRLLHAEQRDHGPNSAIVATGVSVTV